MSLYDDLGRDEAISAALDAFYVKVDPDPRVNKYFDGVDIVKQKSHVGPFLAMAVGGLNHYFGRGLRTAHERPRSMGLDDDTTDVFLGHFRDVLVEFGVDQAHVAAAMEIAGGARDDVLAR